MAALWEIMVGFEEKSQTDKISKQAEQLQHSMAPEPSDQLSLDRKTAGYDGHGDNIAKSWRR